MAVVSYTTEESVALLMLNRPDARHAIDGEMAQGIELGLDWAEEDDSVKAVVLAAAPTSGRPVFCAGNDLRLAQSDSFYGGATDRGGFAGLVRRLRRKPLIAAVDGLATSGGFEVVLACDLVVASTRSSFAFAEVRWGLLAAGGGLIRLAQIAGRNLAMEVALTGEEFDAVRAHQLGIVNRLVDDPAGVLEAAVALARLVAQHPPEAVARAREVILGSLGREDVAWALGEAALQALLGTGRGSARFNDF